MRGSIFRRVDPKTGRRAKTYTIVVPVTGPDGNRRQKWIGGFRTRKAAEARLAEIVKDVNHGTFVEPTKQTVAEYLRQWLDGRTGLRPSTLHGYRILIERHVIPFRAKPGQDPLGSCPLQRLSDAHLDALYASMEAKGLSGRTRALVHTVVRMALAQAVRRGHLSRNVRDLVERPKSDGRENDDVDQRPGPCVLGPRRERSPVRGIAGRDRHGDASG